MSTKQDQAVAQANNLINLMSSLRALRRDAAEFVAQYNSEAYNTTWAAMATAAQNADGSLGAADGSPNTAHPIDNRVTGLTALSKAVPEAALLAGVVVLQDLAKFLGNQAVATSQRSQSVDDLAS